VGLAAIKAIVLDVDGVLTDGGVWWGPDGGEWKRFSFADIMGVTLATKAGLRVALISGEDSALVDRFAAKLKLDDVVKGCKDKAAALRRLAERHHLSLSEICFMGDDINDLGAISIAGFSSAPADSHATVRDQVDFVTRSIGGRGAVRELVDKLLSEHMVDR